MYRCDSCNSVVPRYSPARTVIVDTRAKRYVHVLEDKKKNRRRGSGPAPTRVTEGWEIAREQRVCADCYQKAAEVPLPQPLEAAEASEESVVLAAK